MQIIRVPTLLFGGIHLATFFCMSYILDVVSKKTHCASSIKQHVAYLLTIIVAFWGFVLKESCVTLYILFSLISSV